MRVIVCLMLILFTFTGVSAQGNKRTANNFNFSIFNGKTVKNMASSPNGKFIFIRFTDGTSIRISGTYNLKVQKFGN